jgi:hypothetical protein
MLLRPFGPFPPIRCCVKDNARSCIHSSPSISTVTRRGRELHSCETNTAVPRAEDIVDPLEESVAIDTVDTLSERTASVDIADCGLRDGCQTVATYRVINIPERVGA